MHLCAKKKKKGNKRAAGKRKWEGVRGIVEEEEQWSEKWERYWGSLVRHFRRRRQCDDGWRGKWWMRRREREREGVRERESEDRRERESNCAVLDTSTENTLASCQSDGARLIDFLLFSISISLRVPLSLQNVHRCQRSAFLYILYVTRRGRKVTITSTVPEAVT